jgi:hypothetical protein
VEELESDQRGVWWLCRHDCGAEHSIVGTQLRHRPPVTCPGCNPTGRRRAPISKGSDVAEDLRALGLYTHAECVESKAIARYALARRKVLEEAGRALLDVEAAFVAAGCDEWATAAARVAMLIRDLLRERGVL